MADDDSLSGLFDFAGAAPADDGDSTPKSSGAMPSTDGPSPSDSNSVPAASPSIDDAPADVDGSPSAPAAPAVDDTVFPLGDEQPLASPFTPADEAEQPLSDDRLAALLDDWYDMDSDDDLSAPEPQEDMILGDEEELPAPSVPDVPPAVALDDVSGLPIPELPAIGVDNDAAGSPGSPDMPAPPIIDDDLPAPLTTSLPAPMDMGEDDEPSAADGDDIDEDDTQLFDDDQSTDVDVDDPDDDDTPAADPDDDDGTDSGESNDDTGGKTGKIDALKSKLGSFWRQVKTEFTSPEAAERAMRGGDGSEPTNADTGESDDGDADSDDEPSKELVAEPAGSKSKPGAGGAGKGGGWLVPWRLLIGLFRTAGKLVRIAVSLAGVFAVLLVVWLVLNVPAAMNHTEANTIAADEGSVTVAAADYHDGRVNVELRNGGDMIAHVHATVRLYAWAPRSAVTLLAPRQTAECELGSADIDPGADRTFTVECPAAGRWVRPRVVVQYQ
jgi:hypothetical protein